jgi:hypothetical protein
VPSITSPPLIKTSYMMARRLKLYLDIIRKVLTLHS